MSDDASFEAYLGLVMLVLGEYREANRGAMMDECDLLGFFCVGMGPMFQRVVNDMGRMSEEEMTFAKVVQLIRQSLLNSSVTNSVNNFVSDSGNFAGNLSTIRHSTTSKSAYP